MSTSTLSPPSHRRIIPMCITIGLGFQLPVTWLIKANIITSSIRPSSHLKQMNIHPSINAVCVMFISVVRFIFSFHPSSQLLCHFTFTVISVYSQRGGGSWMLDDCICVSLTWLIQLHQSQTVYRLQHCRQATPDEVDLLSTSTDLQSQYGGGHHVTEWSPDNVITRVLIHPVMSWAGRRGGDEK